MRDAKLEIHHHVLPVQLADPADKPKEFTDLYKSIVKSDDSAKVPTIIGRLDICFALPFIAAPLKYAAAELQAMTWVRLLSNSYNGSSSPASKLTHVSLRMKGLPLQMACTLQTVRRQAWQTTGLMFSLRLGLMRM